MRVGQKADIEDQVGLFGHTVAEAEAHARNQNAFLRRLLAETLRDVGAQFVHIELGGVDNDVGQRANACEMTAFGFERSIDWRVRTQRMRPARLAEAAQQHGVGSFQESDLGRNHAPHCFQNARKLLELRAFAHIHHQRGAADLG